MVRRGLAIKVFRGEGTVAVACESSERRWRRAYQRHPDNLAAQLRTSEAGHAGGERSVMLCRAVGGPCVPEDRRTYERRGGGEGPHHPKVSRIGQGAPWGVKGPGREL